MQTVFINDEINEKKIRKIKNILYENSMDLRICNLIFIYDNSWNKKTMKKWMTKKISQKYMIKWCEI